MRLGYLSAYRPDNYVNAAANANGQAIGAVGPVPEGFVWYCERITCSSNTSQSTGVLEVYVLPTNPQATTALDGSKAGRQDIASGAVVQNGVSDQRSPIAIPVGHFLVFVWTGLANGDKVQASMQLAIHQLAARSSDGKHPGGWTGEERIGDHLGRIGTPPDQVAAVSVPVTSDPHGKAV